MTSAREEQCRSLRQATMPGTGRVIYVRCEGKVGHVGKNHRSWLRKWTDDEEDGYLEDE